jgi:3',5'-cyclic AMP phosphodiesterase CpdA
VRVIQLSDTHLAAADGIPASLQSLLAGIATHPPDLVVHTGDIVWFDPDDTLDRSFARLVLSKLPCRMLAIPGNHDVGFFEADRLPARLATFRSAWGADRFVHDADGWRLIGVDIYTVGDDEADGWLADALDVDRPIAVFIHQPISGEPDDGWQAPDTVRARLDELLAGHDVRVVASGHRHCRVVRDGGHGETHVWAPSATLAASEAYHGGDPAPGAVEFRFESDGSWTHRFLDPLSSP